MLTIKNNMAPPRGSISNLYVSGFFKRCSAFILIVLAVLLTGPVFAQKKVANTSPPPATDNTYKQIVEYSRPGKYHQLLANLVGKWTLTGQDFDLVSGKPKANSNFSGTAVRRSFANGRYFIVNGMSDSTSKMEVPIQGGKMLLTRFRVMTIEGYDNVKKKFVSSDINNNLYSSIKASEGTYDPATKTITFYSELDAMPGMKSKDKLLFMFIDKNHYKWEMYHMENGSYKKESEIDFRRSK
jgi:hypothetical protein